MPLLIPCIECGRLCPKLIRSRCSLHAMEERKRYGMDSQWAKLSRIYRQRNPACELCEATEGLTVHHINGREAGNGYDNLMTLCLGCHGRETARIQREGY